MSGSTERPHSHNIGSRYYEQFAPNICFKRQADPADYFSKQLHMENRRQGLGFCHSAAMIIYLTTSPETSDRLTKFLFGKGERRRLVWPVTNFWCWHSATSRSQFKSLRKK